MIHVWSALCKLRHGLFHLTGFDPMRQWPCDKLYYEAERTGQLDKYFGPIVSN